MNDTRMASTYEDAYVNGFISNKDLNLGTSWPDNEELQESREYKQIATTASGYLKTSPFASSHINKEMFPVSRNFNSLIRRNRTEGITNTWGGLSTVFLLLTWYSLKILRTPWRKSYFKIKAFSGHFQHLVYGNLCPSVAHQLMERLGYIYHKQNQTFLFHQQTWNTASWRQTLTYTGMDFFLVHVHCSLCSTKAGGLMPVDDVISSEIEEKPKKETLKTEKSKSQVLKKEISGSTKLHFDETLNQRRLSSNSQQNLDREWDRIEMESNQYVPSDVMRRDPDAASWMHRFHGVKLSDAASFPDEGIDIYSGKEDPSLIGADIRYPPNDLNFPVKKKEKESRKADFSTTAPTSVLSQMDDNYVTALPMSSHQRYKANIPRRNRVESGYYSQWLLTPQLDVLTNEARHKEAGEFGYAFPIKRPPGDGQPTHPNFYHEIVDDKEFDFNRNVGGPSKTGRR